MCLNLSWKECFGFTRILCVWLCVTVCVLLCRKALYDYTNWPLIIMFHVCEGIRHETLHSRLNLCRRLLPWFPALCLHDIEVKDGICLQNICVKRLCILSADYSQAIDLVVAVFIMRDCLCASLQDCVCYIVRVVRKSRAISFWKMPGTGHKSLWNPVGRHGKLRP